ncbi:unnamed protein product [Adineta ricciae]|uniref:Exocyst complex component 5 n=3 Tax=Adineta ricciae TaxID=249248 RepID=A0A813PDP6_ADIRI|nr:unnamed protein product [Adineta ricciae]
MEDLVLASLDSAVFDVDNLIENIAYKSTDGNVINENFDPYVLEGKFRQAMSILQDCQVQTEQNIKHLEEACEKERNTWANSVAQLEELYQSTYTGQQELEMRISVISTKVIQIGHQLESKSNPRQQLVDARTTAKYLERFLDANDDVSLMFQDASKLEQAAHIIHQLYNVLQELPDEAKFTDAKNKVKERYMAIEEDLLLEFSRAQVRNDKKAMKKYIKLLSKFKGHNDCIQNFITDCLKGYFDNPNIDIFNSIPQLFVKVSELINELFDQPEKVTERLIITVYMEKLAPYVRDQLEPYLRDPGLENMEKYLQTLYTLHKKATKLSHDLQTQKISDDPAFLHKLNQYVFKTYLKTYSEYELSCLEEKFQVHLERLELTGGQRRMKPTGLSITDIIQQRLLNTDQVDESRFSPDLAAALLNDCRTAMTRITTLSEGTEASENILQCFRRLLNALGSQHIDTELQYSLQAIPGPEPKQEPDIRFFQAILQTNNSIQLIERYFVMDIAPLLLGTQQQTVLLQSKEKVFGQLEELINVGVDKSLSCIIGYARNILNEQKRSDFKPESDLSIYECSPICKRVVRSIDTQITRLEQNVDGKNLIGILNEFGLRFHRLIIDHVFKFEYNISGGLMMLQDVSEYKKCSKKFRSSTVEQLFSILHALVNLLVVVPDNLRQVITEGHLASLTRDIIESFVQLRTDYKSARLHTMISSEQ